MGVAEEDIPQVGLWCWSAVHGLATLTKADVFRDTLHPEQCAVSRDRPF